MRACSVPCKARCIAGPLFMHNMVVNARLRVRFVEPRSEIDKAVPNQFIIVKYEVYLKIIIANFANYVWVLSIAKYFPILD